MRILIDGYNLMHAVNLLPGKHGPNILRKLRLRFLNQLAEALGPMDAFQTTVVFDAAVRSEHRTHEFQHHGLTILFSGDGETADDRIEQLIAKHSAPKNLTVVSSDHQIQRAAARKRATVFGSDEFWESIHERVVKSPPPPVSAEERARLKGLTPSESEFWQQQFGHLEADSTTRRALEPSDFVPSDDEIARIEREVEEED
jgi:predicted RNA-binding protein with PIN domain